MKKYFKILAIFISAALGLAVLSGCQHRLSSSTDEGVKATTTTKKEVDPSELDRAQSFVIALYPEYAPITCENFENLVKNGFYDGLTFHRVYAGFMAQGGDPTGTGSGGTDTIKGEFAANGVQNDLSHTRGVVSMARRSGDMDSASCQFFIVYDDSAAPSLDGMYAAFGKVTEGMEVVDSFLNIEMEQSTDKVPTHPTEPITILKAEVEGTDSEGHTLCRFYMQVGN